MATKQELLESNAELSQALRMARRDLQDVKMALLSIGSPAFNETLEAINKALDNRPPR